MSPPLPPSTPHPFLSGAHSYLIPRQEGMCNFIGCPAGYTPIPDAMNVECTADPCEPSQCCEAFCSYHPCPANYIPITDAATIMCPVSGCTDGLCCSKFIFCYSATPLSMGSAPICCHRLASPSEMVVLHAFVSIRCDACNVREQQKNLRRKTNCIAFFHACCHPTFRGMSVRGQMSPRGVIKIKGLIRT